jgi:hypothetical protein
MPAGLLARSVSLRGDEGVQFIDSQSDKSDYVNTLFEDGRM